MAGSNFSAFRKLTPLKGSVTEDLQNQEELGFKRRAEEREIESIAKSEEEKALKKKEALRENIIKNLDKYDTGSRSLNELQGNLISRAVNEYIPIIETLEDPNASEQDKLKARIKSQNIQKLPENLKLVTDFYTKQDAAYKDGVNKGKIFQDPAYEKIFQSGFENYILDLDEEGNPVVAFKDVNKDGKTDILDVQSYEQIKTGLPTFNFQSRYDLDSLATQTAKSLGKRDVTTDSNYRSVNTVEAKIDDLKKNADTLFNDGNGNPTALALSELRVQGLDNTPENINKVKQMFIDKTLAQTDYKRDENLDYSAQTARMAENRQARKDLEEKKEIEFTTVVTPPIYKEHNIKPAKGYETVSVFNSKPIPVLEGMINGKKQTFTNAALNSYTVIKNKLGLRQVVAEVVYQDSKGSTLTPQEQLLLDDPNAAQEDKDLILSKVSKGAANSTAIVTLTEKDGVKFAKQKGLTYNQMKNKAKVNTEEDTRPKTVIQNGVTYTWNPQTKQYE